VAVNCSKKTVVAEAFAGSATADSLLLQQANQSTVFLAQGTHIVVVNCSRNSVVAAFAGSSTVFLALGANRVTVKLL
jgi:hypothetical protein